MDRVESFDAVDHFYFLYNIYIVLFSTPEQTQCAHSLICDST